jgi:hypothetical protein
VTTSLESRLRADLRELADVPGPPSLVDRALADARRSRRRQRVAAGAGILTITALIAVPFVFRGQLHGLSLPFGGSGGSATCQTATDEAVPPDGVPAADQPRFVRVVFTKLPQRDDYFLQSGYGMCVGTEEPAGLPGERLNAYAVINLGPNREHGHLTVTVQHEPGFGTCADVPTPEAQLLFCEDAAATTPLVLGVQIGRPNEFIVTAVYSDDRVVSIGAYGTPFDVPTLRSVVTDPDLVALLG